MENNFKLYAPQLKLKIEKYRPKICWFHGKVAMQNYLKYAENEIIAIAWGEQPFQISNSVVFVTPNPSLENAVFSLEIITEWYKELHNIMMHEIQ